MTGLFKRSYDSRCEDLAAVFMQDEAQNGPIPDGATAGLAQQIQDLIESFIEFDLVELRKGAP